MLRHFKRARNAGLVGATAALMTVLAACGSGQDANQTSEGSSEQSPTSSRQQPSTTAHKAFKDCGEDPQDEGNQSASQDGGTPKTSKVDSSNGVSVNGSNAFAISTPNPAATFAGCEVLAQGGTAADATLAAQLMLGLTEPQSSGPGGGAISVYYDAGAKKLVSLDGTVNAPYGDVESPERAGAAGRVGVPRTLELMRKLHSDYGKLDKHQILQPVIDRANEGFKPSSRLVEAVDSRSDMFDSDHTQSEKYLRKLSEADENSRIKNPDYAKAVRRIADDQSVFGDDGSNTDDVADDIAGQALDLQRTDDRAASKRTKQDERLKQAKALAADWIDAEDKRATTRTDDAACVDYRGKQVCGNSSPATGFTFVNHALKIFSHVPEDAIAPKGAKGSPSQAGRTQAQAGSVETTPTKAGDEARGEKNAPETQNDESRKILSDAQRVVMANANTYMGDPSMANRITEEYLNEVVRNEDRAKGDAADASAGRVAKEPEPYKLPGAEGEYQDFEEEGTSQISVKDVYGNWASTTTTLQKNFGAGIFLNGFFLNNSLDNFSAQKGKGERVNIRKAAAHPKTMMSPLMVLENDQPSAAIGSPGGSKIPSYVLKTLVGVLDLKLTPEQAVLLPNYGAVNRSKEYFEADPPEQSANEWQKGKETKKSKDGGDSVPRVKQKADSGLSVVTNIGEEVSAVSDPRRMGLALGGTGKQ